MKFYAEGLPKEEREVLEKYIDSIHNDLNIY